MERVRLPAKKAALTRSCRSLRMPRKSSRNTRRKRASKRLSISTARTWSSYTPRRRKSILLSACQRSHRSSHQPTRVTRAATPATALRDVMVRSLTHAMAVIMGSTMGGQTAVVMTLLTRARAQKMGETKKAIKVAMMVTRASDSECVSNS